MSIEIPKRPTAWVCTTCGKADLESVKESLASPEHVSYRGQDIGLCKGTMVPLYSEEAIRAANPIEEKEQKTFGGSEPAKCDPTP